MEQDRESEVRFAVFETKECLTNGQMAAAADGKVFRQALNNTE